MDIAEKLRVAVREVPEGDHTPGLSAIVRHVEAAIRHYDRGDASEDHEAFTDCIYRTNQVYEGSLKEAYRILAGADPSKKSLFEIEKYFDANSQIKSRVISQMTRYREEYRNPSAHDYKLVFDESESLLAILSVTAFAKLLSMQMRDKIESEDLINNPEFNPKTKVNHTSDDISVFAENLASSIQKFLNEDARKMDIGSREPLALVSAFLERSGLEITRDVYMETGNDWIEWDMIVSGKSKLKVPIEVITSRGPYSEAIAISRITQVKNIALATGFSQALLVEGAAWGAEYSCGKAVDNEDIVVHRIGRPFTLATLKDVASV